LPSELGLSKRAKKPESKLYIPRSLQKEKKTGSAMEGNMQEIAVYR